ncbi:LOW QUALITY PROTEIN: eukaryotic translation initiation factor 3 subunit K-like [Xenia sp. Carnegie-2017]|uniref:LOW QUALITY PROTEIN: eukaryotic translation initiation factor 3 subunit K-like n=1 Tax=Xenia sp. Carnegie-2017 TaxID=2897299 RepID=UPI001F034992|nr:LOW QUALITY PROTEIN: eukaryotic translation initiation factor 3 subunit K-like [Xenia sp. Carnegie-2017]
MEDSYEVDFEDTREDISLLLHGIDRYNPENLHQLESYVHQQTSENQYDLDANLAVLKLYQFNPQLHQTNVVIQILLKALMNLPRTDFYLCKCLIDENHTHDKSIEKVLYLSDLMETCHFKDFWHEVRNECQDLVEGIKGFEEAVMSYISGVLAITYQSIDAQLLSDLLGGLEGNDLQEWIKLRNWSLDDGKVFICNQEHIKSKNIVEKIDFHTVKGIMQVSR